jgi:hypothetical protein
LILYAKARIARLYHVATDPQEMQDLSGDSKEAPRKKELFRRLVVLPRQFDDPLDLPADFSEL